MHMFKAALVDRLQRGWLTAVAIVAVIAVFHTSGVYTNLDHWGIWDWDPLLRMHGVARESILRYRQFPLWDPYNSGGSPLHANAESRVLSPSFPLILLFGEVVGLKISITVYCFIGMAAMLMLLREMNTTWLPAVLGAAVFMLNSCFSLGVSSGMTWVLSMAYLPMATAFALRLLSKDTNLPRTVCMLAIVLALILLDGSPYLFVITSFWVACILSFDSLQIRSLTPLICLGGSFLLAVGLAAVKLLPMLDYSVAYPRPVDDTSGFSIAALLDGLISREQLISTFADRRGVVSDLPSWLMAFRSDAVENGMYTGTGSLIFAGIGLFTQWRRFFSLLAPTALALAISFGTSLPYGPWWVIRRLPVIGFMREATRFRIVVILCIAVAAAFGLQWLLEKARQMRALKRVANLGLAFVVFLCVADMISVCSAAFEATGRIPPFDLKNFPQFRNHVLVRGYNISRRQEFLYTKKITHDVASGGFRQLLWLPGYDKDGPVAWAPLYGSDGYMKEADPEGSCKYGQYPGFLAKTGLIVSDQRPGLPIAAKELGSKSYWGEVWRTKAGVRPQICKIEWSPNQVVVLPLEGNEDAFQVVLNQNNLSGLMGGWQCHYAGNWHKPMRGGLVQAKVAGNERLIFVYQPPAFFYGLIASCVAVIVVAGITTALPLVTRIWGEGNGKSA